VALAVTQFLANTTIAAPLLRKAFLGSLESHVSSMATDGTNVVAALYSEASKTIRSVVFLPDGDIRGLFPSTPSVSQPYVAYGHTNFLLVWVQGDTNSVDLRGCFLAGQPFTILSGLPSVELRGLSWDGKSFLALWTAQSSGSSSVYGQLLRDDGFPNGGPVMVSSPGANAKDCTAAGSTNHMLLWMESLASTNEWCARFRILSGDGELSEISTLSGTPARSSNPVALVVGNDRALAVWNEERGPYRIANCSSGSPVLQEGYWRMLSGRIISNNGATSGSKFQITLMRGEQIYPKAAFDGTNFLVVWQDTRYCNDPMSPGCLPSVYGQQVSPSGNLVDPELMIQVAHPYHESLVYAANQFVLQVNEPHPWSTEYVLIFSLRPADLGTMGFQTFVAVSNGYSHVQFTGNVSRGFYRLEVSTNFHDWNWVPWADVPDHFVALRPNYPTRWLDPYTNYNGPRFYRAVNSVDTCVSNLMLIQQAKAAWAFEQAKCIYATPADSDIFGDGRYLPVKPFCPLGGTYYWQGAFDAAYCTLGTTAGHTW